MRRLKALGFGVAAFLVTYFFVNQLVAAGLVQRGAPPGWVYLAIFAVLFPVLFPFFFRGQVRELAKFEVHPVEGEISAEFHRRVGEIVSLGYQPLGPPVSFVGKMPLRLQALVAHDHLSYAAVFEYSKRSLVVFDFDSWLEDGRLVNSIALAASGRGLRRPTILTQAIPGISPAELLKHHQEALTSLASAPKKLAATPEDYLASCRETYRRQFDGLGAFESLWLLVPGKSVHSEPIASRQPT